MSSFVSVLLDAVNRESIQLFVKLCCCRDLEEPAMVIYESHKAESSPLVLHGRNTTNLICSMTLLLQNFVGYGIGALRALPAPNLVKELSLKVLCPFGYQTADKPFR
jgi:hypothetical protein